MIPFDSATYYTEVGKTKIRIYRHGETEVVDAFPLPYCYAPSKYEIQTMGKMERTDMKAFDTGENVKRYTFAQPMSVKSFRTNQEQKSITVYEADKKYVGVWMLDNGFVCDDYANQATWDSVMPDTPIAIRRDGDLDIVPIESLWTKNWLWNTNREIPKESIEIYTAKGWSKIKHIYRHKVRKTGYRVWSRKGYVETTEDHSLIVLGNEISPKKLKRGDKIELHSLPLPEGSTYDKEMAWLFGFFIAEGSAGVYKQKYQWQVNNQNRELLERAQFVLSAKLGVKGIIYDTMKSSLVYKLEVKGKGFRKLITEFFLLHCYRSGHKAIPKCILNASKESKVAFLTGLIDGDGWRYMDNNYASITQIHKTVLAGLVAIINSLGIDYSITLRDDKPNAITIRMLKTGGRSEGCMINHLPKPFQINGYVYDIETENHTFLGGLGNINLHNTEEDDSQGKPDPETANVPITAIGMVYNRQKYVWTGPEPKILQGAVDFIVDNKISMLKGWNTRDWDVPFFARRLAYSHIKFDFSQTRFLDLSLAYRFMEKNFRSQWSLEKVGKRFFQEQKPFVNTRLSTLPKAQLEERVLWDADMTERIDQAKEYSRVAIQLAKQAHIFPDQIIGVHPEKKSLTITPVLDQYYLHYAHKIGYVLPCKTAYLQRPKYPGGWVEVYQQGFFPDVLQYDVDSLYPNIILAYRLAPYGRFELVEPIVRELLGGKKNAKDKIERWAYKITANALYGLFASSHYRFKAVEVADQITFHGRDILTHVRDFLRELGYTVYYLDTDSVFVQGKLEDGETIKTLINNFVEQTYTVTNIKFGLESHWSSINFPRSAKGEKVKKKYYGIVHVDKSGKVVDKFEEAGMESLRGDWCELARLTQDAIKKFQVTNVPKEKMLEFYEGTKVKLYQGVYDPLLVLEKHMGKNVDEYGQIKKGKDGKMRKMPTPQHVKALREAMATGWVPNEMVKYGAVQYYMTRGMKPKLANLVEKGDIDYGWYIAKQIDPIMWRLGLIDEMSKYKKEKVIPKDQTTF